MQFIQEQLSQDEVLDRKPYDERLKLELDVIIQMERKRVTEIRFLPEVSESPEGAGSATSSSAGLERLSC